MSAKKLIDSLLLRDVSSSCHLSRLGRLFAILMAFSVALCVTGFLYMIPGKQMLYFFLSGISLLYIILKGGIKLKRRFIFFYLILLVNVIILDINPVFNPFMRCVTFFFITMVCSPFIESYTAVAYREYLFRYLILFLTLLTVLSFFCFFLGINMMPFNREASESAYADYQNNGGKFSGLFCHSMILGPIAAVISLVFFNLYLNKSEKKWVVLFFITSLTCVFSAARSALLGLCLAIFLLMIKLWKRDRAKTKKIVVLLSLTCLLSIPIADIAFSGVKNKMETTYEQFDGYNSREKKYKYRLDEFAKSPIMGIGFASVDSSIGDFYNPENGRIEPGTSHLAVLAQTGLLGMIGYIFILYGGYKQCRIRYTLKADIAFCLFWAFFAHGWAEGWVFAPGGMICFLFWLSLSQCYDLKYREKI